MSTSIKLPNSGGLPGDTDQTVQFNDGGTTFGGDSGLTYNKTTDTLTVVGSLITPYVKSASTGNIPLILESSGTGAIQLQVADNTVVGGNARGSNAIDIQKGTRTLATQVASGSGAVGIGGLNIASGSSSISIGNSNTSSGNTSIAIGNTNVVTSGNGCLGIGRLNTCSGNFSVTVGSNNTTTSGANIGSSNTCNGGYILGSSCTANATYSVALGNQATNKSVIGLIVYSNNVLNGLGKNQINLINIAKQTTDNTPTLLSSSATTANATNQLTLQDNSAIVFYGQLVGNVTGGSNTSAWEFKGCIKRGVGATTTTLVGSVTQTLIAQDAGASSWSFTVTADTTNGCLSVQVTGQSATTIRWDCTIYGSEIAF